MTAPTSIGPGTPREGTAETPRRTGIRPGGPAAPRPRGGRALPPAPCPAKGGPRAGKTAGATAGSAEPVLVAVAHGSRVPEAAREAKALLGLVRALRPGLPVRLGHIELSEPPIDRTLVGIPEGKAVLVPLLLGRGYHTECDIPAALARATHLTGRIAAPLGPHPLLADALYDRLIEAGWRRAPRSAVVLAAAGSRDPKSALGAGRTAAMLADRLGVPVLPAYATASPTVPEAVAALAARGHRGIAVASYFTAPGRFSAQCAQVSPTLASAPLGAHPAVARLVLERYDEAVAAFSARGRAPATAVRQAPRPVVGPGSYGALHGCEHPRTARRGRPRL